MEQDSRISVGEYINEMLKISNDNLEVSLKDIYGLVNIAANESDIIRVLSKTSPTNTEYVEDNRTLGTYIAGLFTYKHYLNDITILGNEKNMYSLGNSISLDFLTKQSWYSDLKNNEGTSVLIPPYYNTINPITSPSQDDKVITIAKPIFGNNQAAVGFVLADVRAQLLTDIFSNNLTDKVKMFIADTQTGNLIFKSQIAGLDNSNSETDSFAKIMGQIHNQEGSFYTRFGKEDYLIVYRFSPLTKWMINFGIFTN